jgi:hypothetical protein
MLSVGSDAPMKHYGSERKDPLMTRKGQFIVALAAAAVGLAAFGAFWLIADARKAPGSLALGAVVYAAAYLLTVPRAERRLERSGRFAATAD